MAISDHPAVFWRADAPLSGGQSLHFSRSFVVASVREMGVDFALSASSWRLRACSFAASPPPPATTPPPTPPQTPPTPPPHHPTARLPPGVCAPPPLRPPPPRRRQRPRRVQPRHGRPRSQSAVRPVTPSAISLEFVFHEGIELGEPLFRRGPRLAQVVID